MNALTTFTSAWLRFALSVTLLCLVPLSVQAASSSAAGRPNQEHSNQRQAAPAKIKKAVVRKGMRGNASYYANRFHGRKTASGHLYYKSAMTAAHRSLPLGTWVRVNNERNGNSVVVQITDRGPYVDNRVIDLSLAAATDLDMLNRGVVAVRLEVLEDFQPAWALEPWNGVQFAMGY